MSVSVKKSGILPSLVLVGLVALAACGGGSSGGSFEALTPEEACPLRERIEGRTLRVVTTVSPITSIAANIAAGTPTEIEGIVPEGANSHTYEPPPSVAATLEGADIVFLNGLGLEEPTRKLAQSNAAEGSVICELGTAILPREDWIFDDSFPEEGGKPNPHVWTNPPMALAMAEVIRNAFVAADPENAQLYRTNYDLFARKVGELSASLRFDMTTLETSQLLLLTYHDAYAYFAREFNWTVIGAIQPSSFDEPTPNDVAALIDQIRSSGVVAIFGSEVFPSSVLEQIGSETGVRYVDVLRDDDLIGAPGDPEHSWLALMRFDYVTMLVALGGDATNLRSLDVSDVGADRAVYAQ